MEEKEFKMPIEVAKELGITLEPGQILTPETLDEFTDNEGDDEDGE